MAFWSSEKLTRRLPTENLVTPFDQSAITHCAYELAMGAQATVTAQQAMNGKERKLLLGDREPVVIPPGQFALLLTKEQVTIPLDAIGFISIRAGKKFEGLVNVSGFHVDPGFSGRLKFSVYNAGGRDVVISESDRVFMLWYADLDQTTSDGYGPAKREQNEISTQDLTRMQGEVASPSQLRRDIVELQHSLTNLKWVLGVFIAIGGALLARVLTTSTPSPSSPPAPIVQPQPTQASGLASPTTQANTPTVGVTVSLTPTSRSVVTTVPTTTQSTTP